MFVAHAGADTSAAQQLHQALSARGLRSFLDSASLQLGDDWDLALPKAQRRSAMTVVLVSSRTEAAFYEREEIAAAVALSRRDPASHRVVPVYLEPPGDDTYAIPYGLRIKHAIAIGPDLTLNQAAQRIAQLAGQTSTGPR